MTNLDSKTNELNDLAAFWYSRIESGMITGAEKKEFESWISEDGDHEKAFREMAGITGQAFALSDLLRTHHDLEKTLLGQDVLDAAVLVKAHQGKQIRGRMLNVFARVAAALLVVLGSIWLWDGGFWGPTTERYNTAVGEQKKILLKDGSVLTLNTNSEIEVAMTESVRRLHLKRGEVYFDVAKDKNRPFEVAVSNAYVKAVGTAFNIKQAGPQVAVLVTEGEVEVRSNFAAQNDSHSTRVIKPTTEILVAGDQLVFGAEKAQKVKLEEEWVSRETLWREGRIILDEKSLLEIAREIQPYIKERIVIADEEVAAFKAGGVFKLGEMGSFFNALEEALPVQVIREKNVIILMRRSSEAVAVKA
ncbi:FecR family protein [Paremcibacter congregatus]|nr:FecR domain-containing protein [Paremcibacter congregatus]QDE28923.1 DUF4880 domain-containing protein [Paremcibacter congregatus]